MSNKKSIEVLLRLKQVFGVKTDVDLSGAMGVSPQTLSSWKGRSKIPYAHCIELAEKHDISLDWLFSGHGPMLLPNCHQVTSGYDVFNANEFQVLTLYRALNAFNQGLALSAIQDRQHVQGLTERIEVLSQRVE